MSSTKVQPEQIDTLMDMYVDWREESDATRRAYERWASVPVAERALAFAAYMAALDREERASSVYADHLSRIQPR